jgi:hypothetical protein
MRVNDGPGWDRSRQDETGTEHISIRTLELPPSYNDLRFQLDQDQRCPGSGGENLHLWAVQTALVCSRHNCCFVLGLCSIQEQLKVLFD